MGFQADIPHFCCLLRAEYTYDLKSHFNDFFDVVVFGIDSVEGQAVGFEVLTDFGALFSRIPISALVHKYDAPNIDLDYLQLWNNFSYNVDVHEFSFLKNIRCSIILKDKNWYSGSYMFTISWFGNNFSDLPGELGFKRGHVIKLDNGCFSIQPGNRIRWHDAAFITKPFPENPDFKTNNSIWLCERSDKWVTEDSNRYFYDIKNKT